MKAILIDAYNKVVEEVSLRPDENILNQWYDFVKCSLVQVGHYITEHDSIIVDEEGLLRPCDHFFTYEGAHQPFAGNGLVVGVDEEGETVSCDISLEEVKSKVKFHTAVEVLHILKNMD